MEREVKKRGGESEGTEAKRKREGERSRGESDEILRKRL